MADREAAQVGAGLEVDAQRAAPGGVPCLVVGVVGDILEHPGIVDEHVDPAVESGERGVPQRARRGGVGEVSGQEVSTALRAMPGDDVAGVAKVAEGGRANAPARAGEENVHKVWPSGASVCWEELCWSGFCDASLCCAGSAPGWHSSSHQITPRTWPRTRSSSSGSRRCLRRSGRSPARPRQCRARRFRCPNGSRRWSSSSSRRQARFHRPQR